MKISAFIELLETFIENECSRQTDGRILMRSHDVEADISFYDQNGDELPPPKLVFQQFIGCGCVSGVDLHFTTRPDDEIY